MARVVFLGTPEYAVPALTALISHHQVLAVITQPDRYAGRGRRQRQAPPAKAAAERHGIPVLQPARLSRDHEMLARLRAVAADVFVLAAYGQILRPSVLEIPPHGVLGLHASLLPRWRGAAPVAAAIRAGDEETGVSVMLTEAGLDTGPVIAQRAIAINPRDTRASLTARLAELAAELLIETLPAWLRGELEPQPQDDSLATYAAEIVKSEGALDWSRSAEVIDRHIRAMTPWPGAFTAWDRQRIKILSARPLPSTASGGQTPGTVIELEEGIGVIAGEGIVLLDELQPPGKRPMSAAAFVRGRQDIIGKRLGRA